MKKDTLKSIIVLGSICLVVAILLSAVNSITAPIIEERQKQQNSAAFNDILPGATELVDVEVLPDYPESITSIKKDVGGAGFVFELSTSKGYSGKPITMLISLDSTGKIVKLNITEYNDSQGYGSKEIFEGLYTGKQTPVADMHAGATVSSKAVMGAINDAYSVFCTLNGVERSPEELVVELKDKILPFATDKAGNVEIEECALDNLPASITKVYKAKTGLGYVVLAKSGDTNIAIGLNVYGSVIYMTDLDGKDLINDSKFASVKADAESIPSIFETENENILNLMISKEIIASADEATPVDFGAVSSNVVAVYTVGDNLAYVAKAEGFGGALTVCYVIASDGSVVNYATLDHHEQANEYAGMDYGTVIGFKTYPDNFIGKNTSEIADDTLLIAGSTFTTKATTACWNAVKAANEILNKEAE